MYAITKMPLLLSYGNSCYSCSLAFMHPRRCAGFSLPVLLSNLDPYTP